MFTEEEENILKLMVASTKKSLELASLREVQNAASAVLINEKKSIDESIKTAVK